MTKEFFEKGKKIAKWADNNMTKDEALKMAIESLEQLELFLNDELEIALYSGKFYNIETAKIKLAYCENKLQVCAKALEQPNLTYEDGFAHGYEAHRAEQALEQPAQEPVALLEALSDLEHQQWMKWAQSIMDSEPISDARKQRWATMMVDYKDLPDNIQEYDREWARKVMALYTHPAPTWQGLSDDERFIIVQNADWDNPNDIAELIEQALKEKNTC